MAKDWDDHAMREDLFRRLASDTELADQLRKVKIEFWEKVFKMGFRSGWKAGQDRIKDIEAERDRQVVPMPSGPVVVVPNTPQDEPDKPDPRVQK